MKRSLYLLILLLLAGISASAQEKTSIYLWESSEGVVSEYGGAITQNNALYINRINYLSSGFYTIQLCGTKENMMDDDDSVESTYFTITLADGSTFKSGDQIAITAMRNNDVGGKSSIHFVYSNGTIFDDTNTWANLGQKHEISFDATVDGGGTTRAKASSVGSDYDAGTEPVGNYSLYPSTNIFVVPDAADGSTSLSLTRNECECKLYITKIDISHGEATAIKQYADSKGTTKGKSEVRYNLAGQRVTKSTSGIIVRGGRKIVQQ